MWLKLACKETDAGAFVTRSAAGELLPAYWSEPQHAMCLTEHKGQGQFRVLNSHGLVLTTDPRHETDPPNGFLSLDVGKEISEHKACAVFLRDPFDESLEYDVQFVQLILVRMNVDFRFVLLFRCYFSNIKDSKSLPPNYHVR